MLAFILVLAFSGNQTHDNAQPSGKFGNSVKRNPDFLIWLYKIIIFLQYAVIILNMSVISNHKNQ